jgi:hypothetical protein
MEPNIAYFRRRASEEAEICRRKAIRYLGQPEAPFLLRIAREFDKLSEENADLLRRKDDARGEKRRLG